MKKVFFLGVVWISICLLFIGSDMLLKSSKSIEVFNEKKLSAATDAGFKDENFYSCVLDMVGKEEGTVLTNEQLKGIETLNCRNKKIKNVTGLEKLTGLKNLDLQINEISSIDVSKNTNLVDLNLAANDLESIDVSKNIKLLGLYLPNNKLSNVDVSKNSELLDLDLSTNQLTNVDLSNNLKLQYLYLAYNKLSDIDVSNHTSLKELYLQYNYEISSIDVSKLTKLIKLDLGGNDLKSLDVSKNINLERFGIYQNNLTSLDLSMNKKLTYLNVWNNEISSLKLPNTTTLQKLNISDNRLSSVDLSLYENLTTLYVSNNSYLKQLDLSKNKKLEKLDIFLSGISNSFDISNNTSIKSLKINNDDLSRVDFSKLSNLENISFIQQLNIPIYGDSIKVSDIIEYVPENIKIGDYKLYNNFKFDSLYEGYYFDEYNYNYGDVVDVDIITDNDDLYTSSAVESEYGNTINMKLISNNVTNSDITNFKGTQEFVGYYSLNFINLTSDKYLIDEGKSTIDVGGDSDEQIKKNLNSSFDGIVYEINNEKLTLKYNDILFKEFKLLRVKNPKTGQVLSYFVISLMIIVSVFVGVVVYKKNIINEV